MMRSLLGLAALPLLGAAPPLSTPASLAPLTNPYADERCPETPMSLARKRGEPLVHRKLGDLPPAEAFAAVDRRIAGCAAPMLMREARR